MDGLKGVSRRGLASYGSVGAVGAGSQPDVSKPMGGAAQSFVRQEAGEMEKRERAGSENNRHTQEDEETLQGRIRVMQQHGQAARQKSLNTEQNMPPQSRSAGQSMVPPSQDAEQSIPQHDTGHTVVQNPEQAAQHIWHRPESAQAAWMNAQSAGQEVRGDSRKEGEKAGKNQSEEAKLQEKQDEKQSAWLAYQNYLERQQSAKEQKEKVNSFMEQLRKQEEAFKKAMDPKKRRNLYDATMDLTLIAQMEKVPGLKAIQSRLFFQMRSVKASGAEASEIRSALNKLKKVIGKAKAKVKNLEKEAQLEKKRKRAAEAKRKTKERALRRELELRKKTRKIREHKDIEESRSGLGANYGGPMNDPELELIMEAYESMNTAAMTMEAGAVVDVAAADVGAAGDAGGAVGAVDVSV